MATLERVCEECGTGFVAKTKRAKYCRAACRVKANRRPSKVGKARAEQQQSDGTADVVDLQPAPAPTYDTLAEQVRTSLTAMQALDTISGMTALRVAQQIDRGGDSGAAVASLSKELTRLVAEAKAEAAPRHRDGVTSLEDRVAAKLRLAQ